MNRLNSFYMPKSGSNAGRSPAFSLYKHFLEVDGTPGVKVGLAVNVGSVTMAPESNDNSRINEIDIGSATVATFIKPDPITNDKYLKRYKVPVEPRYLGTDGQEMVVDTAYKTLDGLEYARHVLERSIAPTCPATASKWKGYLDDLKANGDMLSYLPVALKAFELSRVDFVADQYSSGAIRGSLDSLAIQAIMDGEILHLLAMDEWLAVSARSLAELVRHSPLCEDGDDVVIGLANVDFSNGEGKITRVPGTMYSVGTTTSGDPNEIAKLRPYGQLLLDEIVGTRTIRRFRARYQDILAVFLALWTDVISEINGTEDNLPKSCDLNIDFWRCQASLLSLCRDGTTNRDPETADIDLSGKALIDRFHTDLLSQWSSSYRSAALIPNPPELIASLIARGEDGKLDDPGSQLKTLIAKSAFALSAHVALGLITSLCLSQWGARVQASHIEKVAGAPGVVWNRLKRNLSTHQYDAGSSTGVYFPTASNRTAPTTTYLAYPVQHKLNVAYFSLSPKFTMSSTTCDGSRIDSPLLDTSLRGGETQISTIDVIRDGGLSTLQTQSFSCVDVIVNVPQRVARSNGLDMLLSLMSDGPDTMGAFHIAADSDSLDGSWMKVDRYGIIRNAEGAAQSVALVNNAAEVVHATARIVPGVTAPGTADALIAHASQTFGKAPAAPSATTPADIIEPAPADEAVAVMTSEEVILE